MRLTLESVPVIVLHEPRLVERQQRLGAALRAEKIEATWITSHPAEEVEGAATPDSYLAEPSAWTLKTSFYVTIPPRRLRAAEISLAMKHLDALGMVAAGAADSALVLEDDVLWEGDLRSLFDALLRDCPDDWEMVFIGNGCGMRPRDAQPGRRFYRKFCPAARCTDSYLVRKQAAQRLLTTLVPFSLPIDFELNYQIHVHDLVVYWAEPPIIVQGSQNGLYRSAVQ